jgi:hypothetical protein
VAINQLEFIFEQNHYWYGEKYMSKYVSTKHMEEYEGKPTPFAIFLLKGLTAEVRFFRYSEK